jgi:calmodulin
MADEINEGPSGPQYQLTADQLNAFTEAFNVFAKGGLAGTSEIGRLLRSVGQNPTEASVQRIAVAADVNGTHLIDLDQWLRICEKECGDFMKEEGLLEIFRAFDKSACGSLSLAQLRSILLFYGERISEDQADEFIDWAVVKCGKSADGPVDRINYEVLVKELLDRDPGIQYSTTSDKK